MKTMMFVGARQANFPAVFKVCFRFVIKSRVVQSKMSNFREMRAMVVIAMVADLQRRKNLYFYTMLTSRQIQTFPTAITKGSIKTRKQTTNARLSFVSIGRIFINLLNSCSYLTK